ncbi:hypothetical protein [Tepidicella baoligensis]|uniref:hypothetical protein n=1 Tax=Tepidicella baoligensis TaxID=2707016 RepID=UPI0015DB4F03|nr:hypothetical protein [Tepidicella baoligensis]
MNRSMISASPMTEQAIKGQIGQPAACMIENNAGLLAQNVTFRKAHYGAAAPGTAMRGLWITLCVNRRFPMERSGFAPVCASEHEQ